LDLQTIRIEKLNNGSFINLPKCEIVFILDEFFKIVTQIFLALIGSDKKYSILY